MDLRDEKENDMKSFTMIAAIARPGRSALEMPSPLPIRTKIATALIQCQIRVASAWRKIEVPGSVTGGAIGSIRIP